MSKPVNRYVYYVHYGDNQEYYHTALETAKYLRSLDPKFSTIYQDQLHLYFKYQETDQCRYKRLNNILDGVVSRKLQNYVECSRCKKKVFEGKDYWVDDDTGKRFCSKSCLISSKLNAHNEIVPET